MCGGRHGGCGTQWQRSDGSDTGSSGSTAMPTTPLHAISNHERGALGVVAWARPVVLVKKWHAKQHSRGGGGSSAAPPTRTVSCQHHHKVPALVPGAEKHRVECPTQSLAHGVAAAAQECISLIDEQQQPAPAALRPVKCGMELRYCCTTKRRNITARQYSIVHATCACQPLCCQCLACAWWTWGQSRPDREGMA